jgi:hypothetical protein
MKCLQIKPSYNLRTEGKYLNRCFLYFPPRRMQSINVNVLPSVPGICAQQTAIQEPAIIYVLSVIC